MKKIVSLLLALCLVCCLSAAVTAEAGNPVLGLWYLTSAETQGITINPADLGMSMSFDIKEDGSCEIVAYGETLAGSWSMKDGILTVTDNDGIPADLTINEDGSLTMAMDGGVMIFTRNAPEGSTTDLPAAKEAESEEEFFGTFKPTYGYFAGMTIPLEQLSDLMFGGVLPTFRVEPGKIIAVMGEGEEAQEDVTDTTFEEGQLRVYNPVPGQEEPDLVMVIDLLEDDSIGINIISSDQVIAIYTEKMAVEETVAQ